MGNTNKSFADRWRTEEKLMLLESWARDGFTLQEIAQKIGITIKTLSVWRAEYDDIDDALGRGREVVDYRVENALLKSALGYRTTETKTIILGTPDKKGNRTIRVEKTEKEIAPNVTACMAWLNNRKPKQWKRNRDNVMELKDDKSNITVNIIRHGKDDTSESWDVNTEQPSKKTAAKKQTEKLQKQSKSDYSKEELEWLEDM